MLPREHPDRIRVAFDITAWWLMPGCCCPRPWRCAWGWVNWQTNTSTWEMPPAGPTPSTSC